MLEMIFTQLFRLVGQRHYRRIRNPGRYFCVLVLPFLSVQLRLMEAAHRPVPRSRLITTHALPAREVHDLVQTQRVPPIAVPVNFGSAHDHAGRMEARHYARKPPLAGRRRLILRLLRPRPRARPDRRREVLLRVGRLLRQRLIFVPPFALLVVAHS